MKLPRPAPSPIVAAVSILAAFSTFAAPRTSSAAEDSRGAKRPNLVFILTDDHRADQLGCYGHPFLRTPHLDRLAEEGTLFEQAFVTSAICTPSRVCFFLGQYERRHGVNFNSGTAVSPEAWRQSYPVLLRESGYFTGYVGKNHVPLGEAGYASGLMEESFDYWYGGHGHLRFYPKRNHPIFRNAEADTQVEILEEGALAFLEPNEAFLAGAGEFLRHRPGDRPFCLTVSFNLPHAAGSSSMEQLPTDPELYREAYRELLPVLPLSPHYLARAEIRQPRLPAAVLRSKFRQPSYDYVDTPETLRERLVRKYQTISGIDALVGSLRAKLDELGLAGDTVILFTSDHGIMEGEFGLGGKALNYEPCLRVPMIVHDPEAPETARGQRRDELVLGIDLTATLLALAGIPVPETVQGRDLNPLVRGESPPWREAAFGENLWSTYFGNPRIESVRTAEWKYLRYFENDRAPFEGQEGQERLRVTDETSALYARWLTASIEGEAPVHEELFHVAEDPDETRNLASDPAHAGTLDEMRRHAQRLVREAKGPDGPPASVRLRPGRPR